MIPKNCFDTCKVIECYGEAFEATRVVGYENDECSTIDTLVTSTVADGYALISYKNTQCTEAIMAVCVGKDILEEDIIEIAGALWAVESVHAYPSHIEITARWTRRV